MSYQIDHSDQANYGSITVADQSINQETSLSFVGKNYTGYAKSLAENFLHLLEIKLKQDTLLVLIILTYL